MSMDNMTERRNHYEEIIYYFSSTCWHLFLKWTRGFVNIRKEAHNVERIGLILSMLDSALDTPKKRHIAGGILMSISLLFGGLAITVMTLKNNEEVTNNEYYIE